VIGHQDFPAEPWQLREATLNFGLLAQTESLFALSNGHIGWRGNLDEGEPYGMPGSYLNGFYEGRPLPYAERGFGFPESGQTVADVTNGKLIRLLVDDEPFDVRYGELRSHERVLDFRAGVLRRELEWVSPAGRAVRVTSVRLVSFTQRAIAAICYQVEPIGGPAQVVLQSELVANEQLPAGGTDPRAAAVLQGTLVSEEHAARQDRALLVHHTRSSGLRMAAGMHNLVDCAQDCRQQAESWPDLARLTVTARLAPGQPLRLIKFVAFGWSGTRSRPAVRDQVDAALSAAVRAGWAGLLAEQESYLADFWRHADAEVDGDAAVQQAVRFGLFHVLQAAARAEGQAIPAKGLTGPGYDGHAFWDAETFVLPVLGYLAPDAVAAALRWRHSTLPRAMARARQLGRQGAAFPWRTINGEECSGYWPAGTAAFHVNADIADAVIRYTSVTSDREFEAGPGLDLLVQTARLWRSLGHFDTRGRFRIDGVTGPDEYSALSDNNVYTNLMAQQNMQAAADAAGRHPERAAELSVGDAETEAWRATAAAMYLPYDPDLEVHPQAEGFTQHQVWDFAGTPRTRYPLFRHYPYFDLYRKQVVKQADLVLAMIMRPDAFTPEQKARNFAYYERLTVRDSSLSAGSQAIMAAEVGQLDLAFDYLRETAQIDLADLAHNTYDGLHIAALASVWMVLTAGFGGLRMRNGVPHFAPRLPPPLTRLRFRLRVRGSLLQVGVTGAGASYSVTQGGPVQIGHYGKLLTVPAGKRRTLAIPPLAPAARATQPPGRAPARRPAGQEHPGQVG
jgi:alpha,alpha-trehalose phosphorylase